MISTYFCFMKRYIQPFEQYLAILELTHLAHATPDKQKNNLYLIATETSIDTLCSKLAYWEKISTSIDGTNAIFTQQVKYESGNKFSIFASAIPTGSEKNIIASRRNLRYGSHGIHEYRGKFFPQLVRSLLNISDLVPNSIVLDPMCGSGTTLVEASLLGYNTIGIDLNPLSVLISQAKTAILTLSVAEFSQAFTAWRKKLESKEAPCESWKSRLPAKDKEYLANWFTADTFTQLNLLMSKISQVDHYQCKLLFTVALSNIIRKISFQNDDDLRVRKQINEKKWDVLSEFKIEVTRSWNSIHSLLQETEDLTLGEVTTILGDGRKADHLLKNYLGKVDCIITSPPYATALPYLDTDRLSLYFLHLLSRKDHRSHDFLMIGNREITDTLRKEYWSYYVSNKNTLPTQITDLIDLIDSLNLNSNVGFRRKNLSALLAKYFFDMKAVLEKMFILLKHGAPAYIVVGNNHTIAGGQRIDIRTNELIALLGNAVGFQCIDNISMEMLPSRDIFKKNASNAESIIFLRKE